MKISFRNIGLVQSADLDIKGLTIITGLNDVGKSVLSKCIFSVVKTVFRANELAIEDRNVNLQNLLQQISSVYRQSIKLSSAMMAGDTNQILNNFINQINSLVKDAEFNLEETRNLVNDFRDLLFSKLTESPLSPQHAES